MKRLFAILSLASTLAIPVCAQGVSDTASGAPAAIDESKIESAESIAFSPEYNPAGMDMTVGISSAAGPARLSLSDDQLEKIAKLKSNLADATANKKVQLHALHRQLKDSLIAENVDKSVVMDLQSKINNLKADLSNAKMSTRLETLALLTPEQKQKMRHAALQRQVMGGKKGMGGKHHRGGAGRNGGHGRGHGRGPDSCAAPVPGDEQAVGAVTLPPV